MPFELTKPTNVKLANINIRREKHGPVKVKAIDLKYELVADRNLIGLLDEKLVDALFRSEEEEAQGRIDGVDAFLHRRFPKMRPVGWDLELKNYRFTQIWGASGKGDIVMADCKVNTFTLEPVEGGAMTITFKVQGINIPQGALDKLSDLLDHQTEITLVHEPTTKADQLVIDGTVASFEKDHPTALKAVPKSDSEKAAAATDALIADAKKKPAAKKKAPIAKQIARATKPAAKKTPGKRKAVPA